MLAFAIYFISLADSIGYMCGVFLIFSMIVALLGVMVGGLTWSELEEDTQSLILKIAKRWLYILITTTIIGMLLPDSKTIAAMYLVPKMAENKQLQQVPDKALSLLNKKLDEWADDVVDRKEK